MINFSGCFATVATAGGAAMTAQEVDEEYNGSFIDYIKDKSQSFYRYLKKKLE